MAAIPQRSPTSKVGYDVLRDCHKKAYALLSEALMIDEQGTGDKSKAIDYYSKGVTQLEKGIAYDIRREDLERAEPIKAKMEKNLEMARERVAELLSGAELRGSSVKPPASSNPTESLAVMARKKPQPSRVSPGKVPANKSVNNPRLVKNKDSNSQPQKKQENPVSRLKGIDSRLGQTILDEVVEHELSVTFEDIVGLDLPKRTLREIVILPAVNPELFTGLRAPARGLLLFGPPGNGKTMLAKAVAHESNAKFFNITASTLTSKWVGEGEKLVKALFALAREIQPSVIFIDEVDALLTKRRESENDAMRRLKNEFLICFDGVSSGDGDRVLVMAATNRPQELDDAALRRFEKRIYIPLPSEEARKSVLKKLLVKHKNTISDRQLSQLARSCDGYSGSDLTGLAKDAALGPLRDVKYEDLRSMPADKVRSITIDDFANSMKLVRPSVTPGLIDTLESWNSQYGVST